MKYMSTMDNMKSMCLSIMLVVLSFVGICQTMDGRIELEMRQGMRQPLVMPAKGYGLVMIERSATNFLNQRENIILSGYDTSMVKLWKHPIDYNERLDFVQYEAYGQYAYLIFNHEGFEEIEVIRANISTGEIFRYSFKYFNHFSIQDFCASGDRVYVAGLLKQLPIAIELNLAANKIEALPLPVDGKRVNIQDIYFSKSGDVMVSLAFEKERRKVVMIKSYHQNGTNSELIIEPIENYTLLNGKYTQLGTKSGIAIGTYSLGSNESTHGFYIGGYYEYQEVFKKYHSFGSLDNFFDFMSGKSQERMEEKIQKKEEKGKELKTKYRLLVHDVLERKSDYVMVGEAYYPVYRTDRVKRYTARGYYYENITVFDGYLYTHAVVVSFSKKGEILWDHSFKIADTKLYYLRERVTISRSNDKLTLLYPHEGKIHSMTVQNDKVLVSDKEIELNTGVEGDVVKQSSLGDSEFWYDHYFLTWGLQRIKNLEEDSDNKRRNVFYINKLSF